MNSVKLIGRLARDPEVRYTKTGKAMATFTIAVSRNAMTGPGQEQKEFTDFIPVVVWGNVAEMSGNSLAKGHRVFVEGRLAVRSYEGNDGQKRWVTEVVANFVAQSMESEQGLTAGGAKPLKGDSPFGSMGQDVTDEDIPF